MSTETLSSAKFSNRKQPIAVLLGLIACVYWPSSAFADIVELRDGGVICGKVLNPSQGALVTIETEDGSVIEVDRDGKVVWELSGLVSPSDADRLPNGNTVVSEKDQVREFDRRKNVIWRKEVNWALESNRY